MGGKRIETAYLPVRAFAAWYSESLSLLSLRPSSANFNLFLHKTRIVWTKTAWWWKFLKVVCHLKVSFIYVEIKVVIYQ